MSSSTSNTKDKAPPCRREAVDCVGSIGSQSVCVAAANRVSAKDNDKDPACHIEPSHCVGSPGFQPVRGAAAICTIAFGRGLLPQPLEYVAHQGRQRGAGGSCCQAIRTNGSLQARPQRTIRGALSNPSLKRSANGRPPGPRYSAGVHYLQRGPGGLPSAPA
jgi:hypothetical protein